MKIVQCQIQEELEEGEVQSGGLQQADSWGHGRN